MDYAVHVSWWSTDLCSAPSFRHLRRHRVSPPPHILAKPVTIIQYRTFCTLPRTSGENKHETSCHTQLFFYTPVSFFCVPSVCHPFRYCAGKIAVAVAAAVAVIPHQLRQAPPFLSLRHPKHRITLPLNCGSRHQHQPSMCRMHRRSADQRQVSKLPQTPTFEPLEQPQSSLTFFLSLL